MSSWSITAMSPGPRRLTSRLVRLPSRARPCELGAPRPPLRRARASRLAIGRSSRETAMEQARGYSDSALGRVSRRAASSSSACLRAPASSRRRPACGRARPARASPRARSTVVRARSPAASFSIRKWRSASDAICGRWVMQSDLAALAEPAQPLADRARRLAADAGVHLVEDERRPARRCGHRHQREHHARELAARRRLAQRRGGTPGFGAIRNSTRSAPVAAERLALAQLDLEGASSIASSASSASTRSASARRRLAARLARAPAASAGARLAASASAASALLERHLRVLEPLALGAAALERARAPPPRCRRACAPAGRRPSSRSSTCSSRPGSPSSPARVAAQLAREVLGLDAQRPQARRRARRARRPRPSTPSASRSASARSGAAARPSASGAIASAPPARGGAQPVEVAQPVALREQLAPSRPRPARAPRSRRSRTRAGRGRARASPARPRSSSSSARSSRTRACAAANSLTLRQVRRRRRTRPAPRAAPRRP